MSDDDSAITLAPCKNCGNGLMPEAKFCAACKKHVSWWRNELSYWSSLVGLGALIVSAFAFSTSFIREYWNQEFGTHLTISEFSSLDTLNIWNRSYQDLHLKSVQVDTTGPTYSLGISTAVVIEPGKLIKIPFHQLAIQQIQGTVKEQITKTAGNYVTQLEPKVKEALERDVSPVKWEFIPDVLLDNGPEHKHAKSFLGENDSLFEYGCTISLTYELLRSNKIRTSPSASFPCVGTLKHVATNTKSSKKE